MSIPKQYVKEKTTTILDIPLSEADGGDVEQGGLETLTATMTSLDTLQTIFEGRNVLGSLSAGILALELTPADLTKVTTRETEQRVVTLSATYGSGRQWHEEIPIEVSNLVGVS
jgi:hypothetical protein